MSIIQWILVALLWLAFAVTMAVTLIKDTKEMKAIKSRRELLDEICDYLHEEVAVTGRWPEGHEDFMRRFTVRFEKDWW